MSLQLIGWIVLGLTVGAALYSWGYRNGLREAERRYWWRR